MLTRLLLVLSIAPIAFGQTATPLYTPKVAFEVASIKPAGPLDPAKILSGQTKLGMSVDGARVDIGSLSLSDLLTIAFKVKSNQIAGPDWLTTERFSIQAKLPDGADKDQVPEMLQALLQERFKLTFHRDDKEQSIYALVVGKNGSKLKESPPDDPAPADAAPPATPSDGLSLATPGGQVTMSGNPNAKGGMVVQGAGNGQMRMAMTPEGTMRMEASKMTLSAFATLLTRFVGLPVEDMTDLKGNYQIAVDLSMDDMRAAATSAGINIPAGAGGARGGATATAAPDPSGGGTIFESVQQLGLKLEARKSPIARIVIDHIERAPVEK